ncbi:MAG: histidine kinase [Anaerolineae bacterium]|jgi:sensor histidine kinase YesM
MTEQNAGGRVHKIVYLYLLPAVGFTITVAYATGRYDLSTVATGTAMSGALALLWELDRALIQPRLKRLERDWLQLGLEMAFSVLEHVLGALLALLVCGRVFDFSVEALTAWMALGGMVLAFPVIHGTETALRYLRQLKEKERQEERLRVLATQAELKALKAQVNPHFLFNTLNTIAELIHADPAQAEATVERLAEMFRYVLAGSERKLVPLEEELTFLNDYLEIERARFGKQLGITQEIDPRALDMPVPSLILQPLVENAVRHGRGDDGRIDLNIRIRLLDTEVLVAVADRGPGMPPRYQIGQGPGHGLRNVDERLCKAYGEVHGLQVSANEPQGTVISFSIPAGGRT